MIPETVKGQIRKYALKNAMDYGNARPGNVLAKVAKLVPKESMRELESEVRAIVDEVNSLPRDGLESEYSAYSAEFEKQQEAKAAATSKPRMELDGAVKGAFATRFAPEPSGYIHIGHASAAFLAKEFAGIYEGKAFLYFDDTNPEKESQEFVDSIKRDLEWLGISFDREYYASDNMAMIYDCARKLLREGKAYACECAGEETRRNRFEGRECPHRSNAPETNLEKFQMMLDGKYEEERIAIRLKGDMASDNTALRDPTMLRLKRHSHYRQGDKYIVWPTYDFNTPINDSLNGVTDAIRTREYELRGALYDMVLDYLGLRKPRVHLHARISIKGQPKQKREIRKLISEKLISGYDDPRLVTIAALRRRGIVPEAIRKFVLGFGMSVVESNTDLSKLLAYDKSLIDPIAKRLYYVEDPARLNVSMQSTEVRLRMHPSRDFGSRIYKVDGNLFISGSDAANMKDGETIGLKGLASVKVSRNGSSLTATEANAESARSIQWVTESDSMRCKILIPEDVVDPEGNFIKDSLKTSTGLIESYASSLQDGDIVQLERFGFCIMDDKYEMRLIFISK